MTRPRLLPAVVCVLGLLAAIGTAQGQDDDDTTSFDDMPHITVVGTATGEATPDTAEIRLGVLAEKPGAAEAWDAASTLARDVVDAAKAAGVAPVDIATTSVSLFQQIDNVRQPDGTFKPEAHGFKASQQLRIRVHQLDKIGGLAQTLIGKGASTLDGISLSVAHPEALRDKLRGEAVTNARHQAEILAGAAGVKLGRLLQIERPDQPATQRPLIRGAVAMAATMPIEAGSETLSAEVEATYAIE